MSISIVEQAEAMQAPVEEHLAPPGWNVKNESDAEFAFRCVNESQAEIDNIDAQLTALIVAATERADAIKAKAQSRVSFFTAALATYAEQHKGELLIGKKRSRDFIGGTFSWRKKGGGPVVTDKAALVSWLTEHGDPSLMRVRVEPDLVAIKASIEATGVIPTGMDIEPERDELQVKATPLPILSAPSSTKELP